MAKRRSGAADFDEWDLLDDFPEEEPKQAPVSTQTRVDDDWADYTGEEPASRRKRSRQKSGGGRKRKRSGGKAPWIAVAALIVVAVLFTFGNGLDLGSGGGVLPTISPIPDTTDPILTLPQVLPVVSEPVQETAELPEETLAATTEPYTEPKVYRYYGNQLSDSEKIAYDILKDAFFAQQERVEGICLSSEERLFAVVEAILRDYAELYWYSGLYTYWTYDQNGYKEFDLEPTYDCTPAERIQKQNLVESATRNLLDELYWKSEYEKVKGVYEFLIDNTAYDYDYMGQTLYELFQDGRAVCDAYARATQYMLTELGMEVIYLAGDAGSPGDMESHAWNIVKIDGNYYQLDTTWGDPYSEDGTQTKNFTYFCVTDAEMNKNHWADRGGYPACTSIEHNYFVYEGKFLTWNDTEQIKQWIREADASGERMSFKMANEQLYLELKTSLIDNGELFNLMEEVLGESVGYTYWTEDNFYILTFEW